jgi:indolepyruvate ferredoxin oxidoreductase
VAKGYHKLLAYKDEYEVARLHLETMEKARAEFDGAFRPSFHLAPPLLPGRGPHGRPKKITFGPGWCRCSGCWRR